MILDATDREKHGLGVTDNPADVAVQARDEFGVDERFAVLGAEDEVDVEADEDCGMGSAASVAPLGLGMVVADTALRAIICRPIRAKPAAPSD